ncbi:MAG TPA: hypothetical protein V6D00_07440 [Pantanalinema sp.]
MALKAMRELPDYVLAPGSPDLVGWAVHDREDRPCGIVVDVVVDTDTNAICLAGIRLGDGRHVLVEVAALDLDEDLGVARVFKLSREELHARPSYVPPTLGADVERRYEALFRHQEPVGAWEPSPLDVPFPGLSSRSDRMRHPPFGRKARAHAVQEVHLPHERETVGAEMPIKTGIFAASMPWDIVDAGHETTPEIPGPDADNEVLWQAEQPGLPSAMGSRRPKHEEE